MTSPTLSRFHMPTQAPKTWHFHVLNSVCDTHVHPRLWLAGSRENVQLNAMW